MAAAGMDDEGDASPVSRPKDATKKSRVLGHLVFLWINVCTSTWHVLAKMALDTGANVVAFAWAYGACRALVLSMVARRVDGAVSLDPAHAVRFLWIGLASCGNMIGAMLALRHFSAVTNAAMGIFLHFSVKFVLFALGLEQMSQLKVIRILIYMWGTAVWVVLATGTTDWAASNPDGPATAAAGPAPAAIETGAVDAGWGWGWVASLIIWRCMSSAILFVLELPMHEDYPETTLDSWIYAAGSVGALVVGVVCGVRPVDFLLTGQWEPWIAILHGVLVVTVHMPKAYEWTVDVVHTCTTLMYMVLQPMTTAILSIAFLDTPLTVHEILGGQVIGLVVVVGVCVTCLMERRERRRGSNRP